MGNVNMEAHQIHYKGEETAKTMFEKLDLIAQQVGDLPTFTSDDRVFLEKIPSLPTAEGKTVLTAETDDQGETNLSYAAPEVEGEDVAPEFSDAEAYSTGDLVFHDGILYKFTSDHAAGDWDATEATPTSVAGELSELKNTFIAKKVVFDPASGVTLTTNKMYKCSNILLGTLWIEVPSTLISISSELGTFNVTIADDFRIIGIVTSPSTMSGKIGHFRVNSGKLYVDNNYALPGAGSYKLDITVPLSS